MPIYEYRCQNCGDFSALRPMKDSNLPYRCPTCTAMATRILSIPHLVSTPAHIRQAISTNERSAHAPQTLQEYQHRHHGQGCSCCTPKKQNTQLQNTATPALKSNPNARPWMISH